MCTHTHTHIHTHTQTHTHKHKHTHTHTHTHTSTIFLYVPYKLIQSCTLRKYDKFLMTWHTVWNDDAAVCTADT